MSAPVRVLVVDDDQGARALHCRFLADIPGYTVVATAATGSAALELCGEGIDLVLLDMRLPDISGVEVLHRIRTMRADGPDVLVVSSSHDPVTVRQALAAHVVGYLIKPFSQEVLAARLETYAARRASGADGERARPLAQGEIDRLLNTGTVRTASRATASPVPAARLPKGLSQVTLTRIVSALDPVAPLSAAEVAAACGLSRATARRYLDHLESRGAVDLAHVYGKRGRPRVLYRLTPAPVE